MATKDAGGNAQDKYDLHPALPLIGQVALHDLLVLARHDAEQRGEEDDDLRNERGNTVAGEG